MFVVYPTNIDYLIEPVRLRIGDYDSTVFSDSLVRGALISAVIQLQRAWGLKYLVYKNTMLVSPQPSDVASGYIYTLIPDGYATLASGLVENDVFRNPYFTFTDQSSSIIAQSDEDFVILSASIILIRARLGSSASSYLNWSDGEYSYSNVSSSNTLRGMLSDLLAEYNSLFKVRLASAIRENLPTRIL